MSLWCMDEHACADRDGCRREPTSPTASPATCAGAPATGRSSTPRRRRSCAAGAAGVQPRRRSDPRAAWRGADRRRARLPRGGTTFVAPVTDRGPRRALAARPDARVLAGGSDLVLGVNQLRTDARPSSGPDGSRTGGRRRTDTHLVIGAAPRSRRVGGPRGACARPVADVAALRLPGDQAAPARWAATSSTARRSATRAPVLLALDARLVLRGAAGSARRRPRRVLPSATGRPCSSAGEVLERIEVPLAARSRGTCAPTSSAAGSTATSRRSAARSPRWSRTA